MKNKNKLLLSLFASLAVASTGHAQKKDAPELSPLNVVGSNADAPTMTSGLKTSLSVDSSPKSLSIMSADQIKAQGLKSVGDIIDYTPGISNSQGEGHRDAAVIRGMRTTQDFYRDGIRDDVQYYRPLYNVEQVEIIRGPDALLSGFGGAYGIINRVSKKGVIGEEFTTLSGSADTFGEFNVQLDKNMQLDDSTAFRVNIFGENLENHRDFYYGHGFGVNPTVKYDLGDGSSLDISYEYLDQERFIDRGIPTDPNSLTPVESLKDIVFGDSTENFSTHKAHILRAIFEHEATDSLKGRLSASHSKHDKLYQNLYIPDKYKPSGGVDTNGYDSVNQVVALDGYRDTTKRSTSILSYDLSGEVETGSFVHALNFGAQYLEMSNDNDRYHAAFYPNYNGDGDTELFAIARPIAFSGDYGTSTGGSTANYYDGNFSNLADRTFADVDVLSFYINDDVSLSDSLNLLLGIRFDEMDFDLDDAKSNANDGSDSDSTISPRIGLTFDVTSQAMLYAAYSESFAPKAGDQYASLSFKDSGGTTRNESNTSVLDPDSFENIEFGIKFDLTDGLTLSAAYFEIEANKPELINGSGATQMVNSQNKGFEIELYGMVTDNWFLSAGYTSLDAKDSDGDRLREAPENMFSVWNNYLVSDRLALNLGIVYYDESLTNNGGSTLSKLPDYTRVDLGASYLLTENTKFQVNIENLTDELYFPHSHSKHQASVGAPVHATFGITSSF